MLSVATYGSHAGLGSSPWMSITARTVISPLDVLLTKWASTGAMRPLIRCSLGAWKWAWASGNSVPSMVTELPGAAFAWIVCPLFTTWASPAMYEMVGGARSVGVGSAR